MKYFPIETDPPIRAGVGSGCVYELGILKWDTGALTADFLYDDKTWVRVSSANVHIMRVLDEMPLSTEEAIGEGHVPGTFAYRVEGALFYLSQSEAFRLSVPSAQHYRFVSGGDCLDIISLEPPAITLIPARWDELRDLKR